ncbi:VOC family protein [Spirilliplanes yamanashiensis]|uniref:VOC family protein n=1 Tax=Spirilliplanes yamanashiensis TaxID=42233 RepID=A0A8J4DHX0_9ACTN|nr:VOC family protein [Spirilliplanes yamanashiensis]MDP9814564.1 PhnB protein [Spirilliplanes yamanashiensis]GIJ02216.1 VOC family protein [Spirilliplanes yamanashiensis]
MAISTTTHLNFRGDARAALEFYQSVFGGRLTVVEYGDFGMPRDLPDADKVVFGQVTADNGFGIMAYDVPGHAPAASAPAATTRADGMTLTGERFFVSVRGETAEEVGALWDKLADGADVIEKYGPSAWAPGFGMLTDRFGVTWILDVAAPYAG